MYKIQYYFQQKKVPFFQRNAATTTTPTSELFQQYSTLECSFIYFHPPRRIRNKPCISSDQAPIERFRVINTPLVFTPARLPSSSCTKFWELFIVCARFIKCVRCCRYYLPYDYFIYLFFYALEYRPSPS